MKRIASVLFFLWLLGLILPVVALPQTPTDLQYYETQVKPLLQKRCLPCHSGEKAQAGLRLDIATGWLRGGVSGPAVQSGAPEKSLLIKAIRYQGEATAMPPTGKLPDAEITLLTEWIRRGAPAPTTKDTSGLPKTNPGKTPTAPHWAFLPLQRPTVPIVKKPGVIVNNPIDAFIGAKLEAKGLKPAPPADKRTLLRRVTFDLTGLPPTPEEMDAFLKDSSPQAYEKVVDRLLASPRYGERWGRHWLDVVHYGDTHGYDKDKRRDNAWRYRDYVIQALNQDTPYNRFVREQLAGDVLFPNDPEGMIATGFITAGPWDFVGQVELAEGTVEKAKTRNLDRDDMVANTMSTFVSMTVHCARCHDHKFDPIPQRDYYKLQAVFAGVDRGDRVIGDPAFLKKWNGLQEQKTQLTARRDALNQEIKSASSAELKRLDDEIATTEKEVVALPPVSGAGTSPTNGYHSAIETHSKVEKWVQIDLGKSQPLDSIVLYPARPTDFADTPGFGFPRQFRITLSDDADFARSQTVGGSAEAVTGVSGPAVNHGDTRLIFSGGGRPARYVRVTALELWPRTNDFVFALAEVQVFSKDKNVAQGATVTALDSIEQGRWSTRYLTDNFTSRDSIPDSNDKAEMALWTKRSTLESQLFSLRSTRQTVAESLVKPETQLTLQKTVAELATVEAEIKSLAVNRVYAPLPHAPRPIQVLARGEVEKPIGLVGPGALTCVSGLSSEFRGADTEDEGKRRVALAEWVVSPKNPLTWRSIVNRVWHYHFGRGIVDTPGDFGKNGGTPSHPELLDWLATTFMAPVSEGKYACGQSFKKLHRLIVLSSTYRQSSAYEAKAATVDADNRLLWRMNRSRLDAESTRDTVLAVSGTLDPTMGGPGFELFRFKDDHSPIYDHTALDKINDPKTWRRTVYRFTVRSVPNPFLESLDCADPNINTPVRNTTLTALQSLALLNDPFMLTQAGKFAERLKTSSDPGAQIEQAYRLALARPPKPEEKAALVAYARKYGMPNACRLLFNLSEFVFID